MLLQAAVGCKGPVALIALIRQDPGVDTSMYCQIVFLSKGFVAELAFIRFLTRVNAQVCFKNAHLHKAFMTYTARIWLLPRVAELVRSQMIFL